MKWRTAIIPLALPLLLAAWTGCATTAPPAAAEEAVTVASTSTPPAPAATTSAAPTRLPPSFVMPAPSYDPLFGGSHQPVFGPDRLKIQALCCPEHERATRASFDPLID